MPLEVQQKKEKEKKMLRLNVSNLNSPRVTNGTD